MVKSYSPESCSIRLSPTFAAPPKGGSPFRPITAMRFLRLGLDAAGGFDMVMVFAVQRGITGKDFFPRERIDGGLADEVGVRTPDFNIIQRPVGNRIDKDGRLNSQVICYPRDAAGEYGLAHRKGLEDRVVGGCKLKRPDHERRPGVQVTQLLVGYLIEVAGIRRGGQPGF